jgi:hypothetical protein
MIPDATRQPHIAMGRTLGVGRGKLKNGNPD